jgi:hypothetical protein
MTLGELAQLFNGENKIGADLTVVPLNGWRREHWFDETGLPWVNPSPNMRSVIQATLYPGIGAIEATNLSVGRGTDTPFEHVGAPWIDGTRLAGELNARNIDGICFYPESFTPTSSKFKGEACQGVFIVVAPVIVLADFLHGYLPRIPVDPKLVDALQPFLVLILQLDKVKDIIKTRGDLPGRTVEIPAQAFNDLKGNVVGKIQRISCVECDLHPSCAFACDLYRGVQRDPIPGFRQYKIIRVAPKQVFR